jgi:hypothetical protein
MELGSPEYDEYRSQVETADQAKLAEVRARVEFIKDYYGFSGEIQPFSNYEIVNIDGKGYFVDYVPKDVLGSAFGTAYGMGTGRYAQVRDDLPPEIRNFVKEHELYHLRDTKSKNTLTAELRANFYPRRKDPEGFRATLKASFTKERLKFYYDYYIKSKLFKSKQ